jgi:NitT/TauT family transport system substrate-binding protein
MNRAKAKILLGCALLVFSALGRPFPVFSAESDGGKLSQAKLRIGVPSGTVVYSTYFLAKEMGFYRDEGLDIEMIHVAAVTGLQALLAGDLQFVGAGTTPINAAIRGARLKTIFVAVDKPEFDLYVSPQIRTFADLRGKTVVVSGIGTLTDRLVRELFQKHGVNPKEVVIRGMGSADLRYQSLVQGVVDGSLLSPPLNFQADKEGFKRLAFLGDFLQATSGSVTVTDDFRNSNSDLVFRFVRASLRGLDFYRQNRDVTLRHIMKFLDIKDKELAGKSYSFHLAALTLDGVITEELMRKTIDDSVAAMKAVRELSVTDLFDFSFAKKAAAEREARR